MEEKLNRWVVLASHYIGEHFDHCKPLLDIDYNGIHPLIRFVSTQLYLSCQFSTESSLLLIKEGQEWDAEIINRSIIEGVVKYIYMLQGSEDEMLTKVTEYWETLPDFSAIKRSDRVTALLNEVPDDISSNWRGLKDLKLSDDEVMSLRDGSNKHERKLLEQKWSFSNIVQTFSKSSDENLSLLVHLAYNFGMSSHLIHKDGDGVAMIWERCTRETNRQKAVKLGHMARTISDLCSFAEMRTVFLFKSCNEKLDFTGKLKESYSVLFYELKEAGENFNKVEYEN